MRTRLAAAAALILVGLASRWCAADDAGDYDRRAALTLFNTVQTARVYTLDQIGADQVGKLSLFRKSPPNQATYVLEFGVADRAKGDDRGLAKITSNLPLADLTGKGWTWMQPDADTKAEVIWKKVEKSDAEKFLEVGVRLKVGNVVLSVVQRRPFGEPLPQAAKEVLARFRRLHAQAQANGLFARISVVYTSGRPEGTSFLDKSYAFSVRSEEQRFGLKASFVAPDGTALEVKRFTFRLEGTLAKFAKLEGATWNAKAARFEVLDPGTSATVTLVIPSSSDPAFVASLYGQAAAAKGADDPDSGIRLHVGAKLK